MTPVNKNSMRAVNHPGPKKTFHKHDNSAIDHSEQSPCDASTQFVSNTFCTAVTIDPII